MVLRGLNHFVYFNSRSIRLRVSRTLFVSETSKPSSLIPQASLSTTDVLKKKGKNKPKTEKPLIIDELLDVVEEDEEEDEAAAFRNASGQKESELKILLSQQSKGKKTSKGSTHMPYAEFVKVVPGEQLWNDLESILESLKNVYLHQVTVRSASGIGIDFLK